MSKKNKRIIKEMVTPWGKFKDDFSTGQACLLMVCAACCSLILAVVVALVFKVPIVGVFGIKWSDTAHFLKQILGNKSG